jgi:hypothetical protein
MTTLNKRTLIATAMVIVLMAIFATVVAAMYEGIQAGRQGHPTSNSPVLGQVVSLPAVDTANGAASNVALGAPGSTGNIAIIQPYPGPGPFQPGSPPFGQVGANGDGLSAWGVAFKETADANAQPDADLIKSAYQDAQKKAETLASATGLKLGKLVAITDYTQAEPYYGKLCAEPQLGLPNQPPPAALPKGEPTGTGTGTGTVAPVGPTQPVPAPCQLQHYVVAWVLVRYQIG